MESNPAKRSGGGTAVVVVLVALLVILPMLYVLSVGPLVWLDGGTGRFTENDYVIAAYFPLIWAAESCSPLKTLWTGYISLWEPSPPPADLRAVTY
jgi:hypothetical protein